MALGRKDQALLATLVLTWISAACVIAGTVTTEWVRNRPGSPWSGYGTFCRNTGDLDRCQSNSIDALCVVSILLLVCVFVALTLQFLKNLITNEIGRFIVVGLLFVASILLLGIISAMVGGGFSSQLVMTGCAFAQLLLLIGGLRLGEIFRPELAETRSNYTERPLLFVSQGLMALVALCTNLGMATKEWLGYRTTKGWSGAGTFCRQLGYEREKCLIRLVTTLLSVAASILSLAGLAIVVLAILNLIQRNVERFALTMISLGTSVVLWSTIATIIDSSEIGYSFQLILIAGPFSQVALLSAGIWLTISREENETLQRWF